MWANTDQAGRSRSGASPPSPHLPFAILSHNVRWNLTASLTGRLAVRGLSTDSIRIKAVLQVVDLTSGEFLHEFPVRWEPGSRFSVCRDEVTCIVGAYECYGVAAYDLRDGREIWRRKDLKAIQVVTAFPNEDSVFCGREAKAAHLLDCHTGESLRVFRGVTDIWASPYDATRLVQTDAKGMDLQRPLGSRGRLVPRLSGDTIAAAFSPNAVAVAERRGTLRCIETESAVCRWTYVPEKDRHVEHAAFLEGQDVFLVFDCRHYDKKPPARLLHIDAQSGIVAKEIVLGDWSGAEFCLNATALFDWTGMLVSTTNGQLVRTLAFPPWKGR